MNNFDWLDLDPRALRLLVAVTETGSVTAAAEQLGVSQSAVSHALQKLRGALGDPLFVKSGRGVRATPRAISVAAGARDILAGIERLAAPQKFEPAHWRENFAIAANDLQRDALLAPLAGILAREAPGVSLRVIASNVPSADMLREGKCRLILSPRPPDGAEVMRVKLFEDEYRLFFDALRGAPGNRADFLAARHATVVYEPARPLEIDAHCFARGIFREFAVVAPGFSALAAFLRDSDLIALAPSLLRLGAFRDLASAPPPFSCPKMPMYLIWSRRDHDDPGCAFVRGHLREIARGLAKTQAASA